MTTESERIIREGILPEEFFHEEVRCDYIVSARMKRIWAIEIDLYLKFAQVCDQYGLNYYSIFGSLLGAVRHGGMIPWDDDIDVCMPREDYDFFCKNCVGDFNNQYLLQTPYSDRGSFYSFAKIRNKNTTCISSSMSKAPFCHGIFLDVFPLDYCDPESYEFDRDRIYQCIMKCSSSMKVYNDDLNEEQQKKVKDYYTDDPMGEYEKIQSIASNGLYRNSGYMGIPVNTILKSKQLVWKAEDFSSYSLIPFECIKMRVPIGYENILRVTYGNYEQFPPIEKRGICHQGLIWDPDESYRTYIHRSL